MRIETTIVDGVTVLRPADGGEIDVALADEFLSAVLAAAGSATSVVLDCEPVTFFDSSGMGALTVLLGAATVARLHSKTGARLVAWVLALWPSFLLWSTQILKDSAIAFFVALSVYLSLQVAHPVPNPGLRCGWRRATALLGVIAAEL